MTGIAVNTNEITGVSVGNTPIVAISVGDELVWPSAAPAADMQFVTSVVASTVNGLLTIPASVLPGDLLVFLDRAVANTNAPGATTPSGFTSIAWANVATASRRVMASFKVADALDAGRQIQGIFQAVGGITNSHRTLLVFRSTTAPVVNVGFAGGGAQISFSGNPTNQTLNPVSHGWDSSATVLVAFYAAAASSGQTRNWVGTAFLAEVPNSVTFTRYAVASPNTPSTTVGFSATSDGRTLVSIMFNCLTE